MARMDESELKAIVSAEVRQAVGFETDEMSADRIDGWDAYLKEPYGNEVEGRSSVVSSDVQDTVEWIMPSLIRIFAANDDAVEFTPVGPNDRDIAKLKTKYCNHVWNRDNPGFLNYYTWFKDSLISKVAWVKVYWEKREDWKRETYYGLDDTQFAMLFESPDREIIEHTEEYSEMGTTHDVTIKWKEEAGKICVDCVPSDEVLFSRDARNAQDCRFLAHRCRKPVSDLIEQYPNKRKEIEDLSGESSGDHLPESQSRATVNEEDETSTSMMNKAMREVWVTESYIRVDYDDDGIAEMRKITTAGNSEIILDNDVWDGPRPLVNLSPIIMPHRLVGISIPDLIKDLQLIKTSILRQYLDALYIGNNPRYEVYTNAVEDPSEILTSKPGGIIRKNQPGQVMTPVQTVDVSQRALEGLGYVDQLRENRTGVSPRTQGLSTNALHDTARGEEMLLSAAQSRIELIARVLAETGVKDAFKLILQLSIKYQDKPRTVGIANEWISVNPTEWEDNFDMVVNVGLGTGDKSKKLVALQNIAVLQEKAIQMQGGVDGPFVTKMNVYETASQIVEASDLRTPDLYFTRPDPNAPPQPPKPDPKAQEAQAKIQIQQAEGQAKQQLEQFKAQQDIELQKAKAEAQMQIEKYKADMELMVAREKMGLEAELRREEMKYEALLASEKNAMGLAAQKSEITNVRPGGDVG